MPEYAVAGRAAALNVARGYEFPVFLKRGNMPALILKAFDAHHLVKQGMQTQRLH